MSEVLTAEEFEAWLPAMERMHENSREIVRAILVEQRQRGEVAAEFDVTPQRVTNILRQFEKVRSEIPRGWQRVELWLPTSMVPEALKLEADARAMLSNRRSPDEPKRPRGRPRKDAV